MATFTHQELAAEARKEIGYRKSVYGRLVDGGRMTEHESTRRIAMMAAIAEHFDELVAAEKAAREPTLFD